MCSINLDIINEAPYVNTEQSQYATDQSNEYIIITFFYVYFRQISIWSKSE